MSTSIPRRGLPIVVSAPSGGGKTTLCRQVMASVLGIEFSVSHTTRPPRGQERHGVDYHFATPSQFDDMVDQGQFLEWAHVHGQRYGTSRQEADRRFARGHDVFFDIDVQGGRQILEALPHAVLVFVVPPSLAVLEQRLRRRSSDATAEIDQRLMLAADEIRAAFFYPYWLVNDDLSRAVVDLASIVRAERLRATDRTVLCRTLVGATPAGAHV